MQSLMRPDAIILWKFSRFPGEQLSAYLAHSSPGAVLALGFIRSSFPPSLVTNIINGQAGGDPEVAFPQVFLKV